MNNAPTMPETNLTGKADPTKFIGYGYNQFKKGGVLKDSSYYEIKRLASMTTKLTPKFKKGGSLASTVNIIPNGVLHEENNKLGDKGMPVVKCDLEKRECTKKYEIEKEELILTLSSTEKAEALAKGGNLGELGSFLVGELLENTHSFSNKFNYLNKIV
jgi:hypothetical protein